MTLIELYQSLGADGENGENSRALLYQTHWFALNVDFDPKTGEALPQALSAFLSKVARPATEKMLHDRLWRITEHARPSVERLFRSLSESPRREQAMLPIHAVRELNASSFIKLSNRPGRNIREKLAGKPYMQAVRRFQSVDLPENRLLRAFVLRLSKLLELRRDCLGEEDELLSGIQSWLFSGEAQAIGRWDNHPPNNTLLSHRDYRRIWDAWRKLQTLDDDIARDFAQLEVREKTMRRWNEFGQMYVAGTHHFADMPVLFDYEKFDIRPWTSEPVFIKAERKLRRKSVRKIISEPICVDLAYLHPRYATSNGSSTPLRENYLWQQWQKGDQSVDIELFNADATCIHPDATTVASTELFFSKDQTVEQLDRAARAFSSRLCEVFNNDTLIWIVPDFLNDFELEITRRNINARFPCAEPLPRSVAAVFEQVDYSKITKDGFSVVVVDTIAGKTCATKLIARRDPELRKRLPETKGFYWERCPTVKSSRDAEKDRIAESIGYDIITVDDKGQWNYRVKPPKPPFIDSNTLKRDPRVGQFAFLINLTNSPVVGGSRLYALQQRAGDIPLWRDQIPELSMKAVVDGCHQRFYLVSRGTTIKPMRGMPVSIPVHKRFTLPAGQTHYSFPLQQGEGNKELQFVAYLKSPSFPLKEATACRLKMTYTYGADDPYELKFIPLDSTKADFKSIRVEWRPASEGEAADLENLPVPDFPARKSWSDFQKFPDKKGKPIDLLCNIENELCWIDSIVKYGRIAAEITSDWRTNPNGNRFCFADDTYLSEFSFDPFNGQDLPERGETVEFYKIESRGNFQGRNATVQNRSPQKLFSPKFYFSLFTIWNHGHSLSEPDVPDHFRNSILEGTQKILSIIESENMPDTLKEEIFFFLCCLHKDAPDYVTKRLVEMSNDPKLFVDCNRNVAFAIGDAELTWQQELLENVANKIDNAPIATEILSIALWRSEKLISKLSKNCFDKCNRNLPDQIKLDLQRLSSAILQGRIDRLVEKGLSEEDAVRREREYQAALLCKHLELLLALLRTRGNEDENFKMILAPDKDLTQKYVTLVDGVSRIVIDSDIELKSRISLQIEKPEMFVNTPDLLYALRMYLTGDSGANTIIITGISDD
jgi:hypothetical protein